jgi:hypothetical protein
LITACPQREERKALEEEKDEMHKQLDTMQKKVQVKIVNYSLRAFKRAENYPIVGNGEQL